MEFYKRMAKEVATKLLTQFGNQAITIHKQTNTGTEYNPTISEESVQIIGTISPMQVNTQADIQHGDFVITTDNAVLIDDTMLVSFAFQSESQTKQIDHAKIINVDTIAPNGTVLTQKIQVRTWLK